jgi:hypothetical protein
MDAIAHQGIGPLQFSLIAVQLMFKKRAFQKRTVGLSVKPRDETRENLTAEYVADSFGCVPRGWVFLDRRYP